MIRIIIMIPNMLIQILMIVTRYAGTVMEVCKVNEELNKQLEEVLVLIYICIITLIICIIILCVIFICIIIIIIIWRSCFFVIIICIIDNISIIIWRTWVSSSSKSVS